MQKSLDPMKSDKQSRGQGSLTNNKKKRQGSTGGTNSRFVIAVLCVVLFFVAVDFIGARRKSSSSSETTSAEPAVEAASTEEANTEEESAEEESAEEEVTEETASENEAASSGKVDPRILSGDRIKTVQGETVPMYANLGANTAITGALEAEDIARVLCIYESGWALVQRGNETGFVDLVYFESAESEEYLHAVEEKIRSEEGVEDSLLYSFSADGKTLTIRGTGEMKDYNESISNTASWWNYNSADTAGPINPWMNKNITKIVVEEGVTSIGDNAFGYCKNLEEVVLPDSLTKIGNNAFRKCSSLKKITLPKGLQIIGDCAFMDSGLENIAVPDQVLLIGEEAFKNCPLISFSVGRDNERYTEIDGVLFDKAQKALVAFPKGRGDREYTVPVGIQRIGSNAFYHCTQLKKVYFPESLRAIGADAFQLCYDLEEINFNEGLAVVGDRAFSNCPLSFGYAALPDALRSVGYCAFYKGTIEKIEIPPATAFIDLRAFDPSTTISFTVDERNPYYRSEDGVLFRRWDDALLLYNGGKGDAEYRIPDTTKALLNGAFLKCSALETLIIPPSVTSIHEGTFGWRGYASELEISPHLLIRKDSYAREYIGEMNYDNWEYEDENDWLLEEKKTAAP